MADTSLLTPDDLAGLHDDAEWQAMPYADREAVTEQAIAESARWTRENEGWTPETWQQFGELTQISRDKLKASESFGEKSKYVGGKVVDVLKDSAATLGVAAADLVTVTDPNSSLEDLRGKLPGETVAKSLTFGTAQAVDALDTVAASAISPADNEVDAKLATLRASIDAGDFPLGDKAALDDWLQERNDDLAASQAKWYQRAETGIDGDPTEENASAAVANGLLHPRNTALLTRYLITRDPKAFDALSSAMKEAPKTRRLEAERAATGVDTEGLAGFLNANLGPEAAQYVREAGDPYEWMGTLLAVGAGIKIARYGAKSLPGKLLTGATLETLSEQGSLTTDDPFATLERRWQTAKDTFAGALGLVGTGAVVGKVLGRAQTPGMENDPAEAVVATTPDNQATLQIGDVTYGYNRRELTPEQIQALHETGGIQEFEDQGAVSILSQPVPPLDTTSGLNDLGTPEGDVTRMLDLQSRQGQWQRQTVPSPAAQETAQTEEATAPPPPTTATVPMQQPTAPLVDETGADLISALTDNQLRLAEPTDQAEWDWYRELNRAAQNSTLTNRQAAAAARRGDVSDAKALKAWIDANVLAGPGRGVPIENAAATLSTDPRQQFAVDGTTLGNAILDTIRQRQQTQQATAQMQRGEANAMAQAQAWESDQSQRFNRQGDARRSVPTDRLGVGDRLQISGQAVRVAEVSHDANDNLETVTLDGGPAFGRVNIDVATMPRVLTEDYEAAQASGPFREGPDTAPGATAEDLTNATATAQKHWQAALGVPAPDVPVRYATTADKFGPRTLGEMQLTGPTTGTAIINPARPGAMETIAHETAHFLHALAMSLEPRRWAWLSFGNYYTEAEMPTSGAVGKLWTATMTKLRGLPTNRKLMARRRAQEKKPRSKWSDMDRHLYYLSDARELWARVVEQIVYYQARGHTMSTSAYGYAFSEVAVLTEAEIRAIMPHVRSLVETTTAALDAARSNRQSGSNATVDTRPANDQNRRADADIGGEFAGANVGQVTDGPRSQLPNELGSSPISARPAVEGEAARTSQFGERVQADTRLGPDVRANAPTQLAVQTQQGAADTAAAIIRSEGLDSAVAQFRGQGLPMPVRIAGLTQAVLQYDARASLARRTGNTNAVAAYDSLVDQAIEAKASLEYLGNEAGRNLAMFNAYQRMSPDGMIRRVQRQLNTAVNERAMAEVGTTAEEVASTANEEQMRAEEELLEEILAAITEENTQPTTVENRTTPTPASRESILGKALDWTAGLLEDFANSPVLEKTIQAVDDALKALKGKFFADPLLLTPLGQAALTALRSTLVAGQKLATAVASAIRTARAQIVDPSITDKQLARSLVRELSKQLLKPIVARTLRDASYAASPQLELDLLDAGLSRQRAKTLAAKLRKNRPVMLQKLQAAVRKRVLARLTPRKATAKHKLPKILDIAEKAISGGVWTEQAVQDAYTTYFKLPKLTAAQQQRIADLAAEVMSLPEGVLRRLKSTQMLNELAMIRGIPAKDVLMAAWYANILSGLSTQGVNVWGNGLQLMLRTLTLSLSSPRDFGRLLRGLATGWKPGVEAARTALRTGSRERALDMGTAQQQSALEILAGNGGPQTIGQWLGWLASAGGMTRYVLRALGAMDAIFFHTASEGMAHLAVSRTLRQQGLTPGTVAFNAEFIRQLGGDEVQARADLAQARQELQAAGQPLNPNLINRRAYELRQQRRSAQTSQAATRFGERATFTQTPEGIGAWISALISQFQKLPVAGRLLVPFNQVLSNLFEGAFDWTPVGILRGLLGRHLTDRNATFDVMEARERLWAGVLGTVVVGTVWAAAMARKDESDEDVDLMIYGLGPRDKTKRDQMPKGWRPYSIKISGEYISYAESPLGMALAGVAGWVDAERYSTTSKTGAERMQLLLQSSMGSFSKTGVLSSMADTIDLLTGDLSANKMRGAAMRSVTGLIPGQGLLRDASTLFDDRKISDDSIYAALAKDVPYFRGLGTRPALNAFGEPTKVEGLPVVRRFVTGQRADVDADWLGRNRLKISGLPEVVEIGQYLLPQTLGGVSIEESTKRRSLGLQALENLVMTDDQRFQFAKRSGEMIREGVARVRKTRKEAITTDPYEIAKLQSTIDAIAKAARQTAMNELVGKLR